MRTQRTSSVLFPVVLLVAVIAAVHAQSPRDTPLVAAASHGEREKVRDLIRSGASANEAARDGSTALLWAAFHSDLDMTRALLDAGADVNAPNRYGITPLLQASRTGDAPIVNALLKAGATLAVTHPDGETPLMAASRSGRVDAVRLLLEAGAEVNATDTYQEQTALMWAAAEGHAEVIRALIAEGADPNRQARTTTITERKHADHATGGFAALHFATRNGHVDAVKALIEGGADPGVTNGDGATPTMVAIVNDRLDLAKLLVDLGANPNDGALYFAVDMRDATTDMRARDGSRLRANHSNELTALDLVRLLLERGADPNKPFVGRLHSTTLCCGEEINSSPFFRAAVAADVEALKLMLDHGAYIEWSPAEVKREEGARGGAPGRGMNANVGRTPIMVAMTGGRGAAFAAGPGFERLGAPPFREAANREPLDAVKVLLAAGADPNKRPPDGSTPLHMAVQARQVPIIRELVAAGAQLDAVNKDNLTPLQLAERPEPPRPPGNNTDPNVYRRRQDTREDVIAAVRELMGLGPDDPTPVPPPVAADPASEAPDAETEASTPVDEQGAAQ